jgi:hypothetical protein
LDPKERYDDLVSVIRAGVERGLSRVWTSMPVRVVTDSDGFTCRIQPLIKGRLTGPDGKETDVEIPPIPDVPVQFTAGGGFTITHPIKEGDEGIAVFAARCLDKWWDKGGIQAQDWHRWHSMSDAMYIPGIRSKPRALGGNPDNPQTLAASGAKPSTSSVQIRSDDGSWYIEIAADNAVNIVCKTLTITATDKVHVDSPVLECTGEITAKVNGSKVTLSQHTHGQVTTGIDHTGHPDPGT